jgi:hypothetical protein
MKALVSYFVGRVFALVRSLGPYAAIELLLPGGSVLALLYWWHRRRVRQVSVISTGDTPRVGRVLSEPLSVRNSVRALRQAVSRAGMRLGVRRRTAPGRSQATPLSSCRALAA